ncbi:unnamed protein product, partial [marine sediment metagenome]
MRRFLIIRIFLCDNIFLVGDNIDVVVFFYSFFDFLDDAKTEPALSNTRIIVYTDHEDDGTIITALEKGADNYVTTRQGLNVLRIRMQRQLKMKAPLPNPPDIEVINAIEFRSKKHFCLAIINILGIDIYILKYGLLKANQIVQRLW